MKIKQSLFEQSEKLMVMAPNTERYIKALKQYKTVKKLSRKLKKMEKHGIKFATETDMKNKKLNAVIKYPLDLSIKKIMPALEYFANARETIKALSGVRKKEYRDRISGRVASIGIRNNKIKKEYKIIFSQRKQKATEIIHNIADKHNLKYDTVRKINYRK